MAVRRRFQDTGCGASSHAPDCRRRSPSPQPHAGGAAGDGWPGTGRRREAGLEHISTRARWRSGRFRYSLSRSPASGCDMGSSTMRKTFVRLTAAAAIMMGAALAGSGAANAESVMSACASQWKQAQAAGTTAGETWPQFLAQCKTQRSSAPQPSSASIAPPAPAARPRACAGPVRLPVPVVAARRSRPDRSARADWRRPVQHRGGGPLSLPDGQGRLGQHEVAHLSLSRHA